MSYGYDNQVHCITSTSPFSIVVSGELHRALMSNKTRTPKEYSTIASAQVKLKALESLRLLKQRIAGGLQKTKE